MTERDASDERRFRAARANARDPHRLPRPRRGRGGDVRQARRLHGGRGEAADLRAPALLRGAAARTRLHRGARHHSAHLRHLPGGLPDERGAGDGGCLRRADRLGPAARPAPAAVLRRVDREPQPARLHAPRARLPRLRGRRGDGPRPPRDRRTGPADEEGGQRADGGRGGTRGASHQRPRGRLLDRKSTRLNSSHANISYAVFCLKKTTHGTTPPMTTSATRGTSVPVTTSSRGAPATGVSVRLCCSFFFLKTAPPRHSTPLPPPAPLRT